MKNMNFKSLFTFPRIQTGYICVHSMFWQEKNNSHIHIYSSHMYIICIWHTGWPAWRSSAGAGVRYSAAAGLPSDIVRPHTLTPSWPGYTHALTHTYTQTHRHNTMIHITLKHSHSHPHTLTHTHTCLTHTHTHTHTYTHKCVSLGIWPRQCHI